LSSSVSQQIKEYARHQLGVDLIGFCPAEKLPEAEKNLREFLEQGFQGEMSYLENPELRTDPSGLLPGAQSVIVIAINYYREKPATPPGQGRVARYAWGRDYHKVLRKLLKQLMAFLDQNWPDYQHRSCVDTAPLLEKAFAEKAGIGFYGRNTTLISPEIGSFILLGEIITTLSLEYDAPRAGSCGTCRRCLEACPTQALLAPGKMDARRCISYLTLESRQPIPAELAPQLSNLIAGCDICQEVCPYNLAHAQPLQLEPMKAVKIAGDAIPLEEILLLQNTEQFLRRFAGSPLTRPKREGLIRNSINAAVNAITENPGEYKPKFLPLIKNLSEFDQSEKIRLYAQTALSDISKIQL
jgi:epoxyqueuosine reductase